MLFPKACENYLQPDKHFVKTGQKIRCRKCQLIHDRNHSHDCQKVNGDI